VKISVNVKARHKRPGVAQLTTHAYEVRVAEPPINGQANIAVIKALAAYFGVKKNQIVITSGFNLSTKTIEIGS